MRSTKVTGFSILPEMEKAIDMIQERMSYPTKRAFFEDLFCGSLSFQSYALHKKEGDLAAEIAFFEKKAADLATKLPAASEADAYGIELDAAVTNEHLKAARYDADTAKALLEIIDDVISKVNAIPDAPNAKVPCLNIQQSVTRFAERMMHKYRFNTDPRYRRNMEMNGLSPEDEKE